jgi:hypothetical protein
VQAGDDLQLLACLVVNGELTPAHAEERGGAPKHCLEELAELQLAGEIRQGVE